MGRWFVGAKRDVRRERERGEMVMVMQMYVFLCFRVLWFCSGCCQRIRNLKR